MKLTREYKRGTVLFQQGKPCKGAFILLRGKVLVSTRMNSHRKLALKRPTGRSVLALAEAVEGRQYEATAVAETDVAVHFIPKSDLIGMMKDDPATRMQLLQILAADISALYSQIRRINII